MGRPWLIIAPHPDDEALMYSVAVRAHLAAGRDVHVLTLTSGSDSGVIRKINGTNFSPWWGVWHNPEVEGYQPLSPELLGEARLREQVAALGCLGVPADRIHYAWDLIGEPVLGSQVTVDQVRRALLALLPTLLPAGLPGVWAPSDIVDDNPDHVAAGRAARQLLAERPDLIGDVRWGILPRYVIQADPRLGQVTEGVYTPATTTDHNACINAYRSFAAWQPKSGAFAAGYQSVDDWKWLDGRAGSPRSWYHK